MPRSKREGIAHCVKLNNAAEAIDEARPRIRLDTVVDNSGAKA
jgi:hypothetical protein